MTCAAPDESWLAALAAWPVWDAADCTPLCTCDAPPESEDALETSVCESESSWTRPSARDWLPVATVLLPDATERAPLLAARTPAARLPAPLAAVAAPLCSFAAPDESLLRPECRVRAPESAEPMPRASVREPELAPPSALASLPAPEPARSNPVRAAPSPTKMWSRYFCDVTAESDDCTSRKIREPIWLASRLVPSLAAPAAWPSWGGRCRRAPVAS